MNEYILVESWDETGEEETQLSQDETQNETQESQDFLNYTSTTNSPNTSANTQNYMNSEDISFPEMLISAVEVRPPLWNSRLPLKERSKTIVDSLWKEISNLFEDAYTMSFLQKKWRNLRDTYVKYKHEAETYIPSGSGAIKKKSRNQWKYYNMMVFLNDTLAPRITTTNLKRSVNSKNNEEEPDRKKKTDAIENSILKCMEKIPDLIMPPPAAEKPQEYNNHICQRISEILNTLTPHKKAIVELELYKKTVELCFKD